MPKLILETSIIIPEPWVHVSLTLLPFTARLREDFCLFVRLFHLLVLYLSLASGISNSAPSYWDHPYNVANNHFSVVHVGAAVILLTGSSSWISLTTASITPPLLISSPQLPSPPAPLAETICLRSTSQAPLFLPNYSISSFLQIPFLALLFCQSPRILWKVEIIWASETIMWAGTLIFSISYVILSKLFDFSEPQFPYPQQRGDNHA